MMIFCDIETLPDPSGDEWYISDALGKIKPPSDYKKADFELATGATGTVKELKDLWMKKHARTQAEINGVKEWRKSALDSDYGQIACVSVAVNDGEIKCFDSLDGEKAMLSRLWSFLSEHVPCGNHKFVAHNAKFDLPFLFKRSVILGVKPHYSLIPHGRHGMHHYCTMEAWTGYGGRISLDRLAVLLGCDGKGDMDGSKVYDEWQINPGKVIAYCNDDVRILREIYKRLEFVDDLGNF